MEHHEVIEADLIRFCRVDLLDFWRGKITARRLWVLIRHLPRESGFVQAVSVDARWSTQEYLTAHLIDVLSLQVLKDPKPTPRPAELERLRLDRIARDAALAEMAERIRRRKEGTT